MKQSRGIRILIFVSFLGVYAPVLSPAAESDGPIAWQGWSDQLFERAKSENKLVILDLEAVWCHWCQVMADVTYKDPKVASLINSAYIPVRVDQDANPDLSLRYEEWGWPATVVFAPNGTEIVKRRGFIPPEIMASLLEAIIEDPSPGPSVLAELEVKPAERTLLTQEQQEALRKEHLNSYDAEFGGWGMRHKLIDWPSLEYAMIRAQGGDEQQKKMAQKTLDEALNLLDAEWGGFYQYSDERNWKSPHYEKIMSIQAQYMRLYALAYALWKDERYLEAAVKTRDYVTNFWTSPEGAFYTSQDANVDLDFKGRNFYALKDAERRELGRLPRVDTHRYSRENGWMITALAALYDATGDSAYLGQAMTAAEWVLQNRSLPAGGFRHDEKDRAGPYLGDTLAMGQAFLSLYVSTADRVWLSRAEKAAQFIWKNFKDEKGGGGFFTSPVPAGARGVFQKPVRQLEENAVLARWGNSLFHYTGKDEYRKMAEYAMRYLASPAIVKNRKFLTGLLLADMELAREPLHLAVVGPKEDEKAKALFLTALAYPASYRRVEWWDRREGPLPNPDVKYPELKESAAYYCENKACSLPFFTPEKLLAGIEKIKQKSKK